MLQISTFFFGRNTLSYNRLQKHQTYFFLNLLIVLIFVELSLIIEDQDMFRGFIRQIRRSVSLFFQIQEDNLYLSGSI